MFRKTFAMESANSFRNKVQKYGLLCKNINLLLIYLEVYIYLKYFTPLPMWKLVKMWQKVELLTISVMKSNNFFKWRRDIRCLEWKYFFVIIFGTHHLFEIYHTSHNSKNIINVRKSECFWKLLRWRALLCKTVNGLENYQ